MERDHFGDLSADERVILKWIFKKCDGEAWTKILLAQDRDRWRALVNAGNF